MATETDSGLSGLMMSLVLIIFMAVGLISWATAGTSNSSTNPVITVPPSTPCTRVADSYQALQETLQAYDFGTATIEEVNVARRDFAAITARELAALAPNVRLALGPVRAALDKTAEIASQPDATNRAIANQTQVVASAASAIPTLCPRSDNR